MKKKLPIIILFTLLAATGFSQSANVGIGTTTPTDQLHTTGTIRFEGYRGPGTRIMEIDSSGRLQVTGAGQTFTATPSASIPDNQGSTCTGASNTISVSGMPAAVQSSKIAVRLYIAHPADGDLRIMLVAPNGNQLKLVGSAVTGSNFSGTIFTDAATQPVNTGTAPFIGKYKPAGDFVFFCAQLNSLTQFGDIGGGTIVPNGDWTLRVFDGANGNSGTLNKWEISFTGPESFGTADENKFIPVFSSGNLVNSVLYNAANGNIGVNTANPTYPFTLSATGNGLVQQDNTNNVQVGFFTSAAGGWLQTYTNHPLYFATNGSGAQMTLGTTGNLGIGISNPLATLQVKRGTGVNGTAAFEGTTNVSHFNYSTTEDTYIRGGKINSKVIINDASQGNVGIFTSTPGYPLTLKADAEGFVQTNGTVEVGFYTAPAAGIVQTYSNHPLAFSTYNSATQMVLSTTGFLGIGTTTPAQKLDIQNGKIRFTGQNGTNDPSGLEFTNTSGTLVKSFIGMRDDNTLGFFGYSQGWSFNHSILTGNTGLGTEAGMAKLTVYSASGLALEITGGIKVTGSNKPAFQLTVDDANKIVVHSNTNGDYIVGFIIDNALCNNDASALIYVTPVAYNNNNRENVTAVSVQYDAGSGKWQCLSHIPTGMYIGWFNHEVTKCTSDFRNDNECVTVASIDGYHINQTYLETGAKFNIMIIRQ